VLLRKKLIDKYIIEDKEKKMKSIIKQSNKKAAFTPLERKQHPLGVLKKRGDGLKFHPGFLTGFTIVELLTVMSIIVILIGLLVPALNMVRKYAWDVKQKAQFHSIDAAIELFNTEFSGYPDSSALGPDGLPYCGAMKLCEAMMGQDLMGFHPDSIFRSDGTDGFNKILYPNAASVTPAEYRDNLSIRKGPYLPLESANAYRLEDIYSDPGVFNPKHFVLCDVYRTVTNRTTGKKIGMPILYYKANTANSLHNADDPPSLNIYNYLDNQALVALGIPSAPPTSTGHRLSDPRRFYLNTRNDKVATANRPYRADSYILISAGFDGEYGSPDDVCNYDWKYQDYQN
jgi:type II secretory pathway pseudopilin PulG